MSKSNWSNTRLYGVEGDRVKFTKMSIEDTGAIHIMASDPEVSKYIGWPLTKTIDETQDYVKKMLLREEDGSFRYASIVDKRFGKVIGNVMLFSHDEDARHAEIGYILDKSLWGGKGLGTEIVKMVQEIAFGDMGLRKLHARVVSENIGSAKILEKNGFVEEGRLKDYYNIDGKFMDCVWLGCIIKE